MKTLKQYIIAFFFVVGLFCSCNYHYYIEKDSRGKKKILAREYQLYELQQKYYDKIIVKYQYKPEKYFIDSNFISKTDTSIDCDSFKIFILLDSKEYASMFTKGIIPDRLLITLYRDQLGCKGMIIDSFGKEIIDTSTMVLCVWDVHILTMVRTAPTSRFIKFKITPFSYYIELTNEKANRKTKPDEFIKGAHLRWFYKGSGEI